MGKRSRNKRRAEGLKANETKQERYDRVKAERDAYWTEVDSTIFEPQRINALAGDEPQPPKLRRLAGAVRALRSSHGA